MPEPRASALRFPLRAEPGGIAQALTDVVRRPDPVGPLLTAADQPALFATLAEAGGPPAVLRLTPDGALRFRRGGVVLAGAGLLAFADATMLAAAVDKRKVPRSADRLDRLYSRFLTEEALPALRGGVLPPLLEGCVAFLRAQAADHEASFPAEPAVTVLADRANLDHALAAAIVGDEEAARLTPVAWGEELAATVLLPRYRHEASHVERMELPAPGDREKLLHAGARVIVALVDAGWTLESHPGKPIAVRRGDATIEPFRDLESVAEQRTTYDDWAAGLTAAGAGAAL